MWRFCPGHSSVILLCVRDVSLIEACRCCHPRVGIGSIRHPPYLHECFILAKLSVSINWFFCCLVALNKPLLPCCIEQQTLFNCIEWANIWLSRCIEHTFGVLLLRANICCIEPIFVSPLHRANVCSLVAIGKHLLPGCIEQTFVAWSKCLLCRVNACCPIVPSNHLLHLEHFCYLTKQLLHQTDVRCIEQTFS